MSRIAGHRAVELCAGMGGIGIALRNLGYDVVRAYDSWEAAVDIYNHNFAEAVAETCNLLSDAGRDRVIAGKRAVGEIELVAAGPPCKGFSQLRNGHLMAGTATCAVDRLPGAA